MRGSVGGLKFFTPPRRKRASLAPCRAVHSELPLTSFAQRGQRNIVLLVVDVLILGHEGWWKHFPNLVTTTSRGILITSGPGTWMNWAGGYTLSISSRWARSDSRSIRCNSASAFSSLLRALSSLRRRFNTAHSNKQHNMYEMRTSQNITAQPTSKLSTIGNGPLEASVGPCWTSGAGPSKASLLGSAAREDSESPPRAHAGCYSGVSASVENAGANAPTSSSLLRPPPVTSSTRSLAGCCCPLGSFFNSSRST